MSVRVSVSQRPNMSKFPSCVHLLLRVAAVGQSSVLGGLACVENEGADTVNGHP